MSTKPILATLLTAMALTVSLSTHAQTSAHTMIHVEDVVSSIYPGMTYSYDLYVPQQYNGSQDACLYVGLDGVLCHAPEVMDSLIAAGKMPVTIGVFLQPGVIKNRQGEVLRYNRSNQFDATDATFARYLAAEVLPSVTAQTLADGRAIRLSSRGSDHMIFGLSSGGIAAFTAAWHRPDLFARVFSGVGTFVAMRGGNDLQAMVRKSEPRPIRVFLQDGSNDVWNPLFGHWYEGNQLLASALEFAGYDVAVDWSDGGHNVKRATEIFARVMEWMWRDDAQPFTVGTTQNDLLAKLLISGEQWHDVQLPAAPTHRSKWVAYPDSSHVVLPEEGTNWLWQYILSPDGTLQYGQRFYWLHCYNNSSVRIGPMAFDGDGNLWVVTDTGLQICDQNGRVRGIISLPWQIDVGDMIGMDISDGQVTLSLSNGTALGRRFHITAPTPGVRPESQGQG